MSDVAPDLPPGDHFRFVASLRFRTTAEGGRQTPVASAYRPDCWFGETSETGERYLTGCHMFIRPGQGVFEHDGTLWVPPGGRCVADFVLRYPAYARQSVRAGRRFDVHEGSHVVASGEILSVLDPGPELD